MNISFAQCGRIKWDKNTGYGVKRSVMAESMENVEEIYRSGLKQEIKKDERICYEDYLQHYCSILILQYGVCSLDYMNPDGEDEICCYFRGTRMIEPIPVLERISDMGEKYIPFLEAKTDCVVYWVNKDRFREAILKSPVLNDRYLKDITDNYMELFWRYCQKREETVPVRFCRLLLKMSRKNGEENVLPSFFTYREISAYLGINPITVARIVKALKQAGHIRKSGNRIVLVDPVAVKEIIDNRINLKY